MPVTALQPDIPLLCTQNVVYALPGAASIVTSDVAIERSILFAGPFSTIGVGPTYNKVAGFIRSTSGAATVLATKVLMKSSVSGGIGNNAGNSYAALVLKDNPSYYWNLNEETGLIAADSVGGANGTISGGVTLNQSGAVGKGMLFDGVDDKIVTSTVSFKFPFTFEWWFKGTTIRCLGGTALIGGTDIVGFNVQNFTLLNIYAAWLSGGSSSIAANTLVNMLDGQWHHLVVVFDSLYPKVYVDNTSSLTNTPMTKPLTNLSAPIEIGFSSIFGPFWQGNIDEVAIYPYALSPQQIQSHYLAKNVPPNSYASAVMESKPTNYWQLDEEGGLVANDLVGGKHGTISGGVTLGQAGIGKSMLFNGSTGKIQTTAPVRLVPPFTFETWIKGVGLAGASQTVLASIAPQGAGENFIIFNFSGSSQSLYIGPGGEALVAIRTLDNGQWYHVAWTLQNNSNIFFYVNGVSTAYTGSLSALIGSISKGVEIGSNITFAQFFNGNIDEVAIYNRALSASEIQSHYLSKFGISSPNSYAAKVILSGPSNYWRLNETSGLVANDIVGGAAGTISGGVVLNGESGMTFNGTSGKVVSVQNISAPVSMTIEAWIKTSVAPATNVILTANLLLASIANGLMRFQDLNGAGQTINGVTNLVDSQWHHVVYVTNGTTCYLYRDGILDFSAALTRTLIETGTANIGHNITYSLFFNGQIDDVAIYPRALTPQEILDHFNARGL